MKRERKDLLKRRPARIRYFYCAVGTDDSIHTGTSYGGLDHARKKSGISKVWLSDTVTHNVFEIQESVEDFMLRWRYHYNDTEWDYLRDVEEGIPLPPREV